MTLLIFRTRFLFFAPKFSFFIAAQAHTRITETHAASPLTRTPTLHNFARWSLQRSQVAAHRNTHTHTHKHTHIKHTHPGTRGCAHCPDLRTELLPLLLLLARRAQRQRHTEIGGPEDVQRLEVALARRQLDGPREGGRAEPPFLAAVVARHHRVRRASGGHHPEVLVQLGNDFGAEVRVFLPRELRKRGAPIL